MNFLDERSGIFSYLFSFIRPLYSCRAGSLVGVRQAANNNEYAW